MPIINLHYNVTIVVFSIVWSWESKWTDGIEGLNTRLSGGKITILPSAPYSSYFCMFLDSAELIRGQKCCFWQTGRFLGLFLLLSIALETLSVYEWRIFTQSFREVKSGDSVGLYNVWLNVTDYPDQRFCLLCVGVEIHYFEISGITDEPAWWWAANGTVIFFFYFLSYPSLYQRHK